MKFSIFSRNKTKSDEELVSLYQENGDMEILGELYNRYLEMLFGVCMKYFKDQIKSEDAVMHIFELVAKKIPQHNIEFFKSWLYRVASNHCLDVLRKESRDQEKKNSYINMQSRTSHRLIHEDDTSWMWKEEKLNALEACIEQLKAEQKECINLFYLQGLSYAELSEKLQVNWSKVRSLIQNGKRNLKNCVERSYEAARNK